MPRNPDEINADFDDAYRSILTEIRVTYDAGMNLHRDRNDGSRRIEGKKACDEKYAGRYSLPDSKTDSENKVLSTMRRRYNDFVAMHYKSGETRFAEWFEADWKVFLKDEHGVNGTQQLRPGIDSEVIRASRLSQTKLLKFLAFEVAFADFVHEHYAALLPNLGDSGLEAEPAFYVSENAKVRSEESFDSFQCTAVLVTLINALTHNSNAEVNLYNLKVSKFAEFISQVSGLNIDNIKKDIYTWKRTETRENMGRLRRVRDALTSFDVEIDVSILNDAIGRTGRF